MAANEMFESDVRSAGDMAGVFEYDGDTAYFYLYDTSGGQAQKIRGAIRILATNPDFAPEDVVVRWDGTESKVGLLIRGRLWAAFDTETGEGYGGDYRSGTCASMPAEISGAFDS